VSEERGEAQPDEAQREAHAAPEQPEQPEGGAPESGYPLFSWLAERWALTDELLDRERWLPDTLAANPETPLSRANPLEAFVLGIPVIDPRPVTINAAGAEGRTAPAPPGGGR